LTTEREKPPLTGKPPLIADATFAAPRPISSWYTVDQYILSIRISREEWRQIDFDRLDAIEVEHALDRFELVRSMTSGGELREIEPLAVEV
jgi:hypothetical protein